MPNFTVIIKHYKRKHWQNTIDEINWFRSQSSLIQAIELAAIATCVKLAPPECDSLQRLDALPLPADVRTPLPSQLPWEQLQLADCYKQFRQK